MAHKPNIKSQKNFNLLEYKYITNEQFYKTKSHIYENKSDKIKIIKAYDSSESIAVRNNVVIQSSGEFESDLYFEGERKFFVEHKQDEGGENSKNSRNPNTSRITMFQVTDQTEKIKNKIEKLNQQQFHEETNYLRDYQQSKKPWKIKFSKKRSDGNFFYYGAIVFMIVTIFLFVQAVNKSEVDIYKYLCLFGLFFHVLCLVWYYVLSLEVVTVGPMSGYFSVKKR